LVLFYSQTNFFGLEDVKIKKVDRDPFLKEVAKGSDLKHAETTDKSAPAIDKDVKIKKNEHKSLLSEVAKGADLKKADK